jgi:hypothetical protein
MIRHDKYLQENFLNRDFEELIEWLEELEVGHFEVLVFTTDARTGRAYGVVVNGQLETILFVTLAIPKIVSNKKQFYVDRFIVQDVLKSKLTFNDDFDTIIERLLKRAESNRYGRIICKS